MTVIVRKARCFIDHLTVTAPTLEDGAAFVRQALGVLPQVGGEHPRMATHNLLLRLGDTQFLEVIAARPDVPAPARPRWFALDALRSESRPVLATWVVRSTDIQASLAACSEDLGKVEPMSRGDLEWRITIPADGSLPLGGVAPALIEWRTATHPATTLEDRGLSLLKLELFHPEPERIRRLLRSLELDGPFSVSPIPDAQAPYLVAHIHTAQGRRLLLGAGPSLPGAPRG